MEVGLVHKIDINSEMQQAYLDYAMSVIVARALPDARDGLKPVHRRILYAMMDMGLRPDSAFKKSARIVGEVLGKYHPHGDMAVYEAMARLAQDFSMRYLLVDGQGNFGSVDGDPPAAMRYTEARLTAPAMHMLVDIGKDTVNFAENFDSTLTEPEVLPAAFPNLLVNGATGIAVGMATSIPPHNLGEVVDAMHYLLENWEKLDEVGVEELMQFVQGPDFPTGGVILQEAGGEGLISAYSTGRGRVTVQARAHLEEMERGRNRIIVTELPYMTNKSSLIERIAELAREERIEGIADLRDESDRHGMRIVIEMNKAADPEAVLRDLYKHTPMQSTFSMIMLALVEGEPRLLSLKQALRVYLEHRLEIVRRRSEYDLEKARQRAHILEGLRVALKNLDAVIDLIRRSPDTETARQRLMKKYKLSEIQAQAILDMPLKRLAALERKKIEDEYKELQALIKELQTLLRSPKKMRQVIGDELSAVRATYNDRRRTHIVQLKEGEKKTSLLTSSELVPEKITWLSVTSDGLIARSLDEKAPRFSGRDAPAWLVQATTRDTLYLIGQQGEAAAIPVHAVPESEKPGDGVAFHKISPLTENCQLAAMFSLPPRPGRNGGGDGWEDWCVLTATQQGMVKKSPLSELPGAAANVFTLVRVNEGDSLGWLKLSNGKNEILLISAQGMSIRFKEDEVRPMGLVAAGVMGIKLQAGDVLAGMEVLPQPGEVFLLATDGSAKRVALGQFPVQGRYGQGVNAWKLPASVLVAGVTLGKGSERALVHLKKLAPKTVRLDEAPLQTRAARGKTILEVKAGEQIMRLTMPWEPPRPGAKPGRARTGGDPSGGTGGRRTTKASPRASASRATSA
ncbi:MAG: DNA gyrase subunit A, partial [Chloroflexota bacterium]